LENINIGIIVFDLTSQGIVFRNGLFNEMFKYLAGKDDFKTFHDLLVPKDNNYLLSSADIPEPIQLNGRIFGHTSYQIMEKFVWIFIRDITEKVRLESIAEAVNTSTNIGYVFRGEAWIGNLINSKTALSVLKRISIIFEENIIYIDRTRRYRPREYLLKF
jgi:PAS domain-containing protein